MCVQSMSMKENQSMRILFSVYFKVLFVFVIIRQSTKMINNYIGSKNVFIFGVK